MHIRGPTNVKTRCDSNKMTNDGANSGVTTIGKAGGAANLE